MSKSQTTNDNETAKVEGGIDVNGDVGAMFNLRDWLRALLEDAGCKITDSGMGFGKADLGFTLSGSQYGVSIWPRMKP